MQYAFGSLCFIYFAMHMRMAPQSTHIHNTQTHKKTACECSFLVREEKQGKSYVCVLLLLSQGDVLCRD